MKNQKTIEVRIPEELLEKLAYVAVSEGRSLNNQILLLARNSIAYFERTKGRISQEKARAALNSENKDGSPD